jgi:hypothetical protein
MEFHHGDAEKRKTLPRINTDKRESGTLLEMPKLPNIAESEDLLPQRSQRNAEKIGHWQVGTRQRVKSELRAKGQELEVKSQQLEASS